MARRDVGEAEAARFLSELWPDGLPDGAAIPCVAMRGAPTGVKFATDVDAAAAWLATEDRERKSDCYVQAGAVRASRAAELAASERMRRGAATDVFLLPGFYVDLDVGAGKFDDLDAAEKFAAEQLPVAPTMTVVSGGGLHAWWLFEEPDELLDDAALRRAEARVHGWSLAARHAAQPAGVRVDAVWDLARVCRVPGTHNWKTGEPRPVKVRSSGGRRVSPSDFDLFAVEPSRATAGQGAVLEKLGGVRVDGSADVGVGKFQALSANVEAFAATWEHERPDLLDQSNSGYDMALATMAAMAGWSPQEIVDLVVAHRRKWSHASPSHQRDPLKLKNAGYYASTVAKATEAAEKVRAQERAEARETREAEELEELAAAPADEVAGEFAQEQARRKVREFFRTHLGVELDQVDRFGDSQGKYQVHLRGVPRPLQFPTAKLLHTWTEWRHAVLDVSKWTASSTPASKPPKGWDAAVGAMHRVLVSDVSESGPVDSLLDHLRGLWSSAGDTQRADGRAEGGESVIKRRSSSIQAWGWFRDGDSILVHASLFLERQWDHAAVRPLRDKRDFVAAIKGAGASRVTVAVSGSTASVYRLCYTGNIGGVEKDGQLEAYMD